MGEVQTLEQTLLAYLKANHRGQDRRVNRARLVWAMRTCGFDAGDRQVRKAIEELRAGHPEGACIISRSDLDGYFWSDDPGDVEAALAEDLSRIEAAQEKIANRRKFLQREQEERLMAGRLL